MTQFCDVSTFSSGFLTGFWTSMAEFYMFTIIIALCVCGVMAYCIKSFGMYKMAQKRNFDNAYLAWFPFARYYLFGKISDDINKIKNRQSSNRVILLVLSILNSMSTLIFFTFVFVSIVELLSSASTVTYSSSYEYWTTLFTNKLNSFLIMLTVIFIISLLFNVFYCICANNIFKDYIPKLSALMCIILVLNLFVFGNQMVDPIIFLSISTNEPKSLQNNNQIVY